MDVRTSSPQIDRNEDEQILAFDFSREDELFQSAMRAAESPSRSTPFKESRSDTPSNGDAIQDLTGQENVLGSMSLRASESRSGLFKKYAIVLLSDQLHDPIWPRTCSVCSRIQ
jgi:hypothetical protein